MISRILHDFSLHFKNYNFANTTCHTQINDKKSVTAWIIVFVLVEKRWTFVDSSPFFDRFLILAFLPCKAIRTPRSPVLGTQNSACIISSFFIITIWAQQAAYCFIKRIILNNSIIDRVANFATILKIYQWQLRRSHMRSNCLSWTSSVKFWL